MKFFQYLILLLIFPILLLAEVGKISVVKGNVKITRNGKVIVATSGLKILEQDVFKSQANSTVQIIFSDSTVVTIGANSVFKISEYLYEEKNTNSKAQMSISQGVFKAITGKIGKLSPNNFKLETKSSSIGIRGTNFRGVVPPTADIPEKFACTNGAITVAPLNTNIKPVVVPAGFMVAVGKGTIETPKPYTKADLQEMEKTIEPTPQDTQNEKVNDTESNEDNTQKQETTSEEKKDETLNNEEKQEETKQEETKQESESKTTQTQESTTNEETSVTKDTATQQEEQTTQNTQSVTQNEQEATPKTQESTPQERTTPQAQESTPTQITTQEATQKTPEQTAVVAVEQPITQTTPVVETPAPTPQIATPTVETPTPIVLSTNINTNVVSEISKVAETVNEVAQIAEDAKDETPPIIFLNALPSIVNQATNENLTITGTAEAGARITIKNGDTTLDDTITANLDGKWSYTPNLKDGAYSISVSATDTAGNQSTFTTPVSIRVDTTPPQFQVTSNTFDNSLFEQIAPPSLPQIDSHSTFTTNNQVQSIQGRGEAGATITVKNGTTTLGTTTVQEDGSWNFQTDKLEDGTYTLSVIATDIAGNSNTYTMKDSFTVDTTPPSIPSLNLLIVSNDKVTIANSDTPPSIPTTGANVIEKTSDNKPTLSGAAEVGSTIFIKDSNDNLIGTTQVETSGNWQIALNLEEGSNVFTITAKDKAGNESLASSKTIVVDTTPPARLTFSLLQDTGIFNQDNITKNSNLTFSNQEIDSIIEYSTDGVNWNSSYQVVEGENKLFVRQKDAVGNPSATSFMSFVYDTNAPTIAFDTTQSTLNALSGSVNEFSSIKVNFDGEEYTINVDTNQKWVFSPHEEQKINDGAHQVSISTEDIAGNVSTNTLTMHTTTLPDTLENSNNLIIEDYSEWGYWTAKTTQPQTNETLNLKGWWISGTKTPQTVIDALIQANTTYSYSGHIAGDILANGAWQSINLDENNKIKLDVQFGSANPVTLKEVGFSTSGGVNVSQQFNTTTSPNITTNTFSANATNATSSINLSNGKFYGPNAETTAGQWSGNFDGMSGSGIFKASR